MSAYFVTSTGTGVGKTFVTCALLATARDRGWAARGFKPIISGWTENADSDTAQIITAGSSKQCPSEISPWRFVASLSPHRAAKTENLTIDVVALEDWCRAQTIGDGLTLIEGAGGVMTPITDSYTMLDLMVALKLPVILVAGSYLGSITHTLTALEVLRTRMVRVHTLVITETAGSEVTLRETRAGLQPFLIDIAWCIEQPLVASWADAQALQALVEKL
jgi:dethiobiotin synthetase